MFRFESASPLNDSLRPCKNYLTTWSRVLTEKRPFANILIKIDVLCVTSVFVSLFTSVYTIVTLLSQMKPVSTVLYSFCNVHFNIIIMHVFPTYSMYLPIINFFDQTYFLHALCMPSLCHSFLLMTAALQSRLSLNSNHCPKRRCF
jgi:hypothetical protein